MTFTQVVTLLTGMALFLFGMSLMGDGLKRLSGDKLEPLLFRLSNTPLRGMMLGAGVTAIIQSSAATSVMAVGFVNSKMMKLRQAMSVILGSILGTSITGWVLCLSYIDGNSGWTSILSTTTLTGVIAVIGIMLRMFGKKQIYNFIGDIMLGFAVLMFGMSTMSGSVSSLGNEEWFTSLLSTMKSPILGILVGALAAAVLQSASAAVGVIQALSITGALSFEAALPILMGVAIGASVPVLISAIGADTEGKRTAVSYLVISSMGVMICASLFYIAEAVFDLTFLNVVMTPFSIALINTLLRFCMVLFLAPLSDLLETFVVFLVKGKNKHGETDISMHLEERFLKHPALAIEQSRLAICEMSKETETAIKEASVLPKLFNNEVYQRVCKLEEAGDKYEDALGSYLAQLTGHDLDEHQSRIVSKFLHTLSDFERISDHALNIAENAKEIYDKRIVLTDDAKHELSVITAAINEVVHLTVEAFNSGDLSLAAKVEPLEEVIDDICDEMKLRHVERVRLGKCNILNGFVFNDLLINFERVSDHCSNIAVAIIELDSGSFDTHEYLENIKEKRTPDFQRNYNEYRARFEL